MSSKDQLEKLKEINKNISSKIKSPFFLEVNNPTLDSLIIESKHLIKLIEGERISQQARLESYKSYYS
tara:strand:- start:1974 stop:2177 length:204 start_codon:yes stop_codon:yes gene_type:complete